MISGSRQIRSSCGWFRLGTESCTSFETILTVLLAAANEIRVATSPSGASSIRDALAETESNLHRWNALVGFVDAAIRDGTRVIANLDDVPIETGHSAWAAPALGRTTVSLHKERRTGVANRGSAFDGCSRPSWSTWFRLTPEAPPARAGRCGSIFHVEASRGTALLSIRGGRPPVDSWRFALYFS